MKLSRFWRALEDLPAGADTRYAWRQRLGDELTAAEGLLRRTGRVATVLSCPSPGGDRCPRRVVRHADGSLVAVCGNRPRECAQIDISLDDLAIYELDTRALASQIGRSLDLRPAFRPAEGLHQVWQIGFADIAAGCSFPVYLTIPTERNGLLPHISRLLRSGSGPFGLLSPTQAYFSEATIEALSRNASDAAALEEITEASAAEGLACLGPAQAIFPRAWAAVEPDPEAPPRAWSLPPDVKWENIIFAFEAEEMLRVTCRGESRTVEPIDLGMRDARTKKPTLQWKTLQVLAVTGGSLRTAKPSEAARIKKQKQLFAEKLQAAFGIKEDPVPWDPSAREYRARFVIRGDVLRDILRRRRGR